MQVKGVALRTTLEMLASELGQGARDRVWSALPPDVRDALAAGLLPSTSYPVAYQAALHQAIRSEVGGGELWANRRVGAAAARRDFGGIYRVFVLASSYERLLRGVGRAFRHYNSQGAVAWEHIGEGSAMGHISEVDGYVEGMWHAIAGRLETLLVMGGAHQASVVVEAWSPTSVTLRATWR